VSNQNKIDSDKCRLIAFEVIKALKRRFDNFPIGEDIQKVHSNENLRNAPFHIKFLQAFEPRIKAKWNDDMPLLLSLTSWLHGLDTTLGQSFFEAVAHILSGGEKRVFKDYKITVAQAHEINTIMTDLKNNAIQPNIYCENCRIRVCNTECPKNKIDIGELTESASQFTADNFVEKDDIVEAVEIKSVRPNSNEAANEKRKILTAKVVLHNLYPNKEIKFWIGFPFDPFYNTEIGCNKTFFMKQLVEFNKYFDPQEVLLANELWDCLSGVTQTMETILEIINAIATPDFEEKFKFINDIHNYNSMEYIDILQKWYIIDKRLQWVPKPPIFNKNGDVKKNIFNTKK
jgi:hypothetical protein